MAFDASHLLQLLDTSLGISMRDLNNIRQVQRLQTMKVADKAMIIASEYQIKRERKAMDIIVQNVFDYRHAPNEAKSGGYSCD